MDNTFEFIQINALLGSLQSQDVPIYKLYLSIGAKWNQHTVDFGVKSKNQTHFSNSIYQMAPSFMRFPEEGKYNILIVVDDFHQTESIQINQTILKRDLEGNGIKNLKIIFVDAYINVGKESDFIDRLFNPLFSFIQARQIQASQFKIVNFISFQRPNQNEFKIERNLPTALEMYLKTHANVFTNCYYQWYGYLFYYYDYIFPYFTYKFAHLRIIMPLQSQLFAKTLYSTRLDPFEYDMIDDYLVKAHPKDSNLSKTWHDFKYQNIHLLHSFEAQS